MLKRKFRMMAAIEIKKAGITDIAISKHEKLPRKIPFVKAGPYFEKT